MPTRIIECVPNFSEGRDAAKVQQIVDAIAQYDGVEVLHVDMGYDANRTVITFAGEPGAMEQAAFAAIEKASLLIDMREQQGTHPRIGACDVMPIVPISGVTNSQAIAFSYHLSERVAQELSIPVYNYELSARQVHRRRLELIRKGEYEGLENKMQHAAGLPDYGVHYNPQTGASVIGARPFLLAYNVNLKTRNVALAKRIAAQVRESGQQVNGVHQAGYFKGLKAIGWDVPEYGMVQVSTNITNTEELGMHQVYEKIKELALASDVEVGGSELIGLTPLRCILASGHFYAEDELSEEDLVALAIEKLGLASVVEFTPQERIIEYLLQQKL